MGVTNHMIEAKSAFSEFESGIRETVKFGDAFVVEIEGRGRMPEMEKGCASACR